MLLTYVPVVSNADSGSDIYYKRAMSSYNSFLERMENGGNDGEWNFKVEEFALQDLNNDGIPELITHGGGRTDYAKIYSCQEGFFQSVHYGSSLNYYTNGIVEVSFSSGNGYWSDSFYKLNIGSLRNIEIR